ncbi:MAG: hypothetical protein ACTTKC_00255 [Treponema sp.]|uniref:hypothetical protein n=1 Tax=Treponema sp. TaxID=166 RepID=UPI003FA2C06A
MNKNIQIYAFFSLLFFSCRTAIPIELGDSIPENATKTNIYILFNAATQMPLFKVSEYIYIGEMNNEVVYIQNNDRKFRTLDGYKIGDTIESYLKNGGKLMAELGVCFFIILKNNWFGFVAPMEFPELEDINSQCIRFFYKKKVPITTPPLLQHMTYEEFIKNFYENTTRNYIEDDMDNIKNKILIISEKSGITK